MSSIFNKKTETLRQSSTKIQSFSGCEYMDESKHNVHTRKRASTMSRLLHTIFALKKDNNSNKNKQQNTKQNQRKPIPNRVFKPSLQLIYKNELLLNTLINFMEASYNNENILFLLAIQKLKQTTSTLDINYVISSIYNTYIIPYSEYQINLSYQCMMNVLSKIDTFLQFDIKAKHSMFDQCVSEIETLIITSILPSFYRSPIFQNYCANIFIEQSNCNKSCLNFRLSDSTTTMSTDVNSDEYL